MRGFISLRVAVGVVVTSAIAGGLFGGKVLSGQDSVNQSFDAFASALSAVEANYVDEVDTERLVYRSISGMLQTLDPHSNFMDPRSYAQLRERQEGRYYGLGIQINVFDGRITVMSLFEGSPAYRSGIRRGDVIAEIEGENAIGMSSDQAVQLLRGPRGSFVNVSMRREGYEIDIVPQPINFFTNTFIDAKSVLTSPRNLVPPGAYVELEALMDLICIVSSCPVNLAIFDWPINLEDGVTELIVEMKT